MEVLYILVFTLVSIVSAVYIYFKIAFNYWKSRNVPYPEPIFPLGNIKGVATIYHMSDILDKFYHMFKGTAKFCGIYFAMAPSALLLDLDLIKSVLIRDFTNFDDRGMYYNEKDDPISAHLFALDGDEWRHLRAKLTSTFTSGKMKFMYPTVVAVGERFRDHLQSIVKDRDVLEVKDLLARFTTDVIGTCAFGIECNSLNDPNSQFCTMGKKVFAEPRHNQFIAPLIQAFPNVSRKFGVKMAPDDLAEFFMSVVRDTVEYREKNGVHRNDFMDLLIKLKNEPSDDGKRGITLNQIAAQAFVFFLAGFETSSITLAYCLYELAMNPDIQAKAREEIQAAYDRHRGEFTYEMMVDMPYIDHVIKETLRKYPPLTVLIRRTKNKYTVPGTNQTIEKNVGVLIPIYSIQMDEQYFPDPHQFNPNRFQSDEVKKRDLMTWLPFGEGPRNCIGLRFGMMQARVGLVMLLNNFEFTTCAETTVPLPNPKSFILSPIDGIFLKLKPLTKTE